jgi:small subunit ribosomal protein S19
MDKKNNIPRIRQKRPPYIRARDVEDFKKSLDSGSTKPIKIGRRSVILSQMIGRSFLVHNGKIYVLVTVTKEQVGLKFGALVASKKFHKHGGSKEAK